ncbi:hypothetical protein FE257_012844 [Aspergillus nanangensis]|uniref:Major facilitator superfamily (MFS) profile domain-containing protein n=1 Tax=Aspergillus nanangensis TaxID=2582783 RepID=A0AAD4CFE4_ASPNN|nr:hypothetical protein FE257_012844 [Aspergillus nanangensis]
MGSGVKNEISAQTEPASTKDDDDETATPPPEVGEPYTVFSQKEKMVALSIATTVNFLAPTSGSMYYPALVPLAHDLNVSQTKINLTIVTFMIAQALVPQITGGISDNQGRRPILLLGLFIYLAVNIGLALQTSFAALLVLRCFQSFGSAGAAVVAGSITADLVTRAERGRYVAITSLGRTVGPALGPLLGGVLTKCLGWRSTFWFLAIFSAVLFLVILLFLRETCRSVVGNGSLPCHPMNRPVVEMIRGGQPEYRKKKKKEEEEEEEEEKKTTTAFRSGLKIILDRELGLLILWTAVFLSGSMAILSTMPALLDEKYQLNPLQVGLCYLPYAVGGLVSRFAFGKLTDWNFQRHAQKAGVELQRNRQSNRQMQRIPLEKARLQLALPLGYFSGLCLLGYGWVMDRNVHLAGPLVVLFFLGGASVGAVNMASTLLLDLHASQPGMVLGALAMYSCFLGAGVVAAALPLMQAVGIGWLGTIIAGIWALASSLLWVLYVHGHRWRMERDGILD